MKKTFYKAISVLLSFLILFCSCNLIVLGSDLDLDMGEMMGINSDAIFVNDAGEVIPAADEYCKITTTGLVQTGQTITLSVDFGDGTSAYEFVGWYDGENLVSIDKDFTFVCGSYGRLTPVIRTYNVLTAGASFESITTPGSIGVPERDSGYYYKSGDNYVSVKTGDAPTGNLWGSYSNYTYPQYEKVGDEYVPLDKVVQGYYNGDVAFSTLATVGPYKHTHYVDYSVDTNEKTTTIVYPHSGNTMVAMNPYWRSRIKELSGLEKNTNYILTFWVYTQNPDSVLSWAAIASNYEGLRTGSTTPNLDSCEVLNVSAVIPNYGEWTKVQMSFNSGDYETLYFHIGNNKGRISGGNEGMNFIDDITVCKTSDIGYTTTKELVDNGNLTTFGATRYNGLDVALDFTGSGIEFNVNCEGTVSVDFSANLLEDYQTKLRPFVNGVAQEDIILRGDAAGTAVLAENLPVGQHHIKLVRITENNFGNIAITGVNVNGEYLEAPAKKPVKFEFYGDSITAGYGVLGESVDGDWGEDGTKTYAYLTSEALGADANIFAYSGIGIAVGGNPDGSGMTMINRYASFPKDSNADVVSIFLGTNDNGKFSKLGLTLDDVIDIFVQFIKMVREDHPNSIILMLHYDPIARIVLPAVAKARADGITNLYDLDIPGGNRGGASHPDIEEQQQNAKVVTEFLRGLLQNSVEVSSVGNGAAKVSKTSAENGETVTLTATPYSESKFLGWYNNDVLFSTEEVYNVSVTDDVNYVAKFADTNIFDGAATVSDWKEQSPQAPKAELSGETRYGGTSYKFTGIRYQAMYLPLKNKTLKANTTYKFQMSYKSPGLNIYTYGIANLNNEDTMFNKANGGEITNRNNFISSTSYSCSNSHVTTADWTDLSLIFTTGDTSFSNIAFYLDGGGWIDNGVTEGVDHFFISDFSLVEVGGEEADFSNLLGNSIRITGNQGLRFKYGFDEELPANGFEGYNVKEIGAVVIRTDYLGGKELKMGGTYNYAGKDRTVTSGAFYSNTGSVDMVSDDGEAAAVLFNIGYNKTNGALNYEAYKYNYSVRTYMVLTYKDTEITLYGETNNASIFDVMSEIETSYNANNPAEGTNLYNDYIAVSSFLTSTKEDVKGKTISDVYTAWKQH